MISSKKKIIFITSQVNHAFGGGQAFLEKLLDNLDADYEAVFIGKYKQWLEIFESRNLQTYQIT